MDSALVEAIAKWGVIPAMVLYAASLLIPKLFASRAETVEQLARASIVKQLNDRVEAVEAALEKAITAFDAEREKRIMAEDNVYSLTRRVVDLEGQITRLGHKPN